MSIEDTIKLLKKQLTNDVKGVYVSSSFFDNLKNMKKIIPDTIISNEIMGYFVGRKIPVICDFINICEDKSKRYRLDDLGEQSFYIKK